jgi:hypothetical protein
MRRLPSPAEPGCVGAESGLPRLCPLIAPPIPLGRVLACFGVSLSLHSLRHLATHTQLLHRDHHHPAPRLDAKTLTVEANDAKTFSSALLRYK